MNYNTLKTSVAAVIKENGNNEITGDILQQTLIAMINSLGVGYQFMGVAQPSTNPGAPDQRVFYIAAEPGTYTGFNAEVVPGEIAIFKFSNTWLKDSIFAIDLANVGFKGVFESGIGLDPSDGEPIIDVNYDASDYIPVGPGCVIVYSGGETDSNRAAIIGYDEDKYMVSVLLAGGSDWKNKIVAITDPDIKYVRVSSCNANHENYNTPFAFNVVATTDVLVKVQELIEDVELLSQRIQQIDPVINVIRNGYTFKGIALPNETLTEDVVSTFYWIETAGTYPGGVLAANEVGLLIWNGADWTIEKLNLAKATALAVTNTNLSNLATTVTNILSVVAAGYEYMGVVTPNSVFPAETYKYKVAFLAQTPGTYTNHGAFAIAENEVALLMYGPASEEWSKQTLDVAKLSYSEETYAKHNGEYPEMKVGQATTAENVSSAKEDSPMFTFRKTPVAANVLRIDEIKGNSIVWNQLYNIADTSETTTISDVTITDNRDGSYTINGTASADISVQIGKLVNINGFSHKILFRGISGGSTNTYYIASGGAGFGNWLASGEPTILTSPSGYSSFGVKVNVKSGVSLTNKVIRPQFIDLTEMFGTAIADAMTVEKFEALYDGFHSENPGTIKNLMATGMKFTGLNQWDEISEPGAIDNRTGQNIDQDGRIRCKNYILLPKGATIYIKAPENTCVIYAYDANRNFLGSYNSGQWNTQGGASWAANLEITIPSNAQYIRFAFGANYGVVYHNDVCISISGPRNGEYEPYREEFVYTNIGGGFNLWDEEYDTEVAPMNRIKSKNYCRMIGGNQYYVTGPVNNLYCYDANKNGLATIVIANNDANRLFTAPAGTCYFMFIAMNNYGTTYNHDICVNTSDPSMNGTYQPYTTLTGKLDGQGESEQVFPNGAMGINDVADLIRAKDGDVNLYYIDNLAVGRTFGKEGNNYYTSWLATSKYAGKVGSPLLFSSLPAGITSVAIVASGGYNACYFYGAGTTYADVDAFKAAVSGVSMVYQLNNPRHYVWDTPLNLMANTDPDGTQMLLPPQTGMSEPTSAPMLAEIEYYVNALKGVVTVETLKNLLDSFKAANKISSYTMTWNDATGEYDFTIS